MPPCVCRYFEPINVCLCRWFMASCPILSFASHVYIKTSVLVAYLQLMIPDARGGVAYILHVLRPEPAHQSPASQFLPAGELSCLLRCSPILASRTPARQPGHAPCHETCPLLKMHIICSHYAGSPQFENCYHLPPSKIEVKTHCLGWKIPLCSPKGPSKAEPPKFGAVVPYRFLMKYS